MDKLGTLEECGGCGMYHRSDYRGDCRNDAERFDEPDQPEDYGDRYDAIRDREKE